MLEAAGLDLLDLVSRVTPLRKASNTDGGEYVGACPDCGGTDRFHVWPNAERPHWRCGLPGRNGCGRGGDLIQWLIDFGGLGFPEAARAAGKALVDHRPVRPVRPPSPPAPRLPPDTDPPPPAWQARARAIAARAAEVLWSPDGAAALRYLREERGLSDATIQAAGLGYVPVEVYDPPYKWGLTGKRVYVPPGITIPVEAHGALWALKVRRLDGSIPRYIQPRDGKVALYGADQLQGRALCVLTEGEFDALLLRQEAGDLVDVATLGSATALPTPRWAWALRHAGVWLVAYDRDAAGAKGGARMAALSRRVRIVQPFSG
ncbi:MAG TPA: hypothetical protein VFB73_02780, partial [Chloroflexota bacterium]|nr:hypothetical protein [Chloroflexota bacterium]